MEKGLDLPKAIQMQSAGHCIGVPNLVIFSASLACRRRLGAIAL